MRAIFTPLSFLPHTLKPGEIDFTGNAYLIRVSDRRIRKTFFSDLLVRGPFGLEPAMGYSKMGNGSVFSELRIEDGMAEVKFAPCANQVIRNPAGMKLIFVS